MDERLSTKSNWTPLKAELDRINGIADTAQLAEVHRPSAPPGNRRALQFQFGQDFKDSNAVIRAGGPGGIGLPRKTITSATTPSG